jgi:hypothetical protein
MKDEELMDEMVRRLGEELKGVLRQVRRGEVGATAIEQVVRRELWHVGGQALGVMLEALDRQLVANRRVHDHRTRTVMSLFGALDVSRSRYRDGSRWCYPLDEAMGLMGQRGWTVGVQEAVSLLSCECSFQTVADLMDRQLGLPISAPTVQSLAEGIGQRAEALQAAARQGPPKDVKPVDTLIVAVDGCQARQRDGWHEVKVATIYSNEGRCPISNRSKLRDKEYFATLENAQGFGQALWDRAVGWGIQQVRRMVVMGDGAPWVWNLADLHFPGAIEIVDFYHAVEHLWEVGEALWGDRHTSRATRSWVRHYRRWLKLGRVDLVIEGIGRARQQCGGKLSHQRSKTVSLNVEYFRRNAHRMRYGRFRQMNLPIGTGAVEGACKHVVQARFKRPGSRWSRPGLQSMLALKLMRLNNRWEQLWPHLEAA